MELYRAHKQSKMMDNLSHIAGNLTSLFPGLFTAILHMCITIHRSDLVISLLRDLRLLHSKDYYHDKLESIKLSKTISYKFANICRLITFNVITDDRKSYMTDNIKQLLNIPTFLLFNAGGNYLTNANTGIFHSS